MPKEWTDLGSFTVAPNVLKVDVGGFQVDAGDDSIWFNLKQLSGQTPWPWSYGVLSWETAFGHEFGSCKAYTERAGETFRLGVGRPARAVYGRVYYEPRSFNLAWIKKGNPLTLSLSAASGGAQATGTTSVAFPVQGGSWSYNKDTGLVQLRL